MALLSLSSMVSLLIQNACLIKRVRELIHEDNLRWWGFDWDADSIAHECAIFFVAVVLQRLPQPSNNHATRWKKPGVKMVAVLFSLFAIHRLDSYGVLYSFAAAIFLWNPTKNPKWLAFFSTVLFVSLTAQIAVKTWLPPTMMIWKKPSPKDLSSSFLCAWYGQEKLACGE